MRNEPEMTPEAERQSRDAWLVALPPAVREKALQYPSSESYTLRTTGLRAQIYSYDVAPDGACETCTVITFNRGLMAMVRVFGTLFTDLQRIQ